MTLALIYSSYGTYVCFRMSSWLCSILSPDTIMKKVLNVLYVLIIACMYVLQLQSSASIIRNRNNQFLYVRMYAIHCIIIETGHHVCIVTKTMKKVKLFVREKDRFRIMCSLYECSD